MKASEYKKVKQECEKYIKEGRPLVSYHIYSDHSLEFTFKQYYELFDIINAAIKESGLY